MGAWNGKWRFDRVVFYNKGGSMNMTTMWMIKGISGEYFITKMDAEIRARECFPSENEDQRYARIHYKEKETEGDVVVLMDNLLWAARELAAGRELAVEGANYLCDAQDWLNAQK